MSTASSDTTVLLILCLALAVVGALSVFVYFRIRLAEVRGSIANLAQEQLNVWQRDEVARIHSDARAVAQREAEASFLEWQLRKEADIRADAIMRSQAVIAGKVSENLVPFMPAFPFNPKDVRFVGSPIDLIVFDGVSDESVREVVFLEIKTGNSALSTKQRQVRDAIKQKKVAWLEVHVETGGTLSSQRGKG